MEARHRISPEDRGTVAGAGPAIARTARRTPLFPGSPGSPPVVWTPTLSMLPSRLPPLRPGHDRATRPLVSSCPRHVVLALPCSQQVFRERVQ